MPKKQSNAPSVGSTNKVLKFTAKKRNVVYSTETAGRKYPTESDLWYNGGCKNPDCRNAPGQIKADGKPFSYVVERNDWVCLACQGS